LSPPWKKCGFGYVQSVEQYYFIDVSEKQTEYGNRYWKKSMAKRTKKEKFTVGDQVNVSDRGCLYNKFQNFARVNNLDNWAYDKSLPRSDLSGTVIKTREYTITHIALHNSNSSKMLAAIKDNETGWQYIMGLEGIKLSEKHKIILEDELFEI
jgi:hypothetical protein